MRERAKWILVLPVLLFLFGVWLFVRSQNQARVQFERAQQQWRTGNHSRAAEQFRVLQEKFPASRYADDALWELANLYYVNLYDLPRALEAFELLWSRFPRSALAVQARLKSAEIHMIEFGDIARAIEIWRGLLALDIQSELRQQVRFKIAEAGFQTGDLDGSFEMSTRIIREGGDQYLVQKARVLAGTILQIRKEYQESIDIFRQVLESTVCSGCLVQAQLGMIECYEYLDQLSRAIEAARGIRVENYPANLKEDLLQRLIQKRKFYEPKQWNGH